MTRLLLALCLACTPLAFVGCQTPPSARVVQAQTLKAVGEAAEAAVALSAHLYADGKITAAQARAVNAFFDAKFEPPFRLAVAAVKADLSSSASPELAALAGQLVALVAAYQK
jgi:hypothetical protein